MLQVHDCDHILVSSRTIYYSMHKMVKTAQCFLLSVFICSVFAPRLIFFFYGVHTSPFQNQKSSCIFTVPSCSPLCCFQSSVTLSYCQSPHESNHKVVRLPLSVDQIIWLTVLPHSSHFRDQWQLLWSNAKLSNFLSTEALSPFFCLPMYQQWFLSADIFFTQWSRKKNTLKLQGEENFVQPPQRREVLTVPLLFPFPE